MVLLYQSKHLSNLELWGGKIRITEVWLHLAVSQIVWTE